MKPSIKAALISALVFPGLGHLVLKRGARGCLFLVPAALAVFYLLRQVLEVANTLIDQVLAGTLPLDPDLIAARISASGAEGTAANVAALVCVLCWAGSIIDALRLGAAKKDVP